MKKKSIAALGLAALIAGSVLLIISAQAGSGSLCLWTNHCFPPTYQKGGNAAASYYPVKFVCNMINASYAWKIGVEPGFYYTDIDIHNPSFSATNVTIALKFVNSTADVLQTPPAIQWVPAKPSPYSMNWVKLGPNADLRLDCRQIIFYLTNTPTYGGTQAGTAKGFVIIYTSVAASKNPLNVNVEYTTQSCYPGIPVAYCAGPPAPPTLSLVQVSPLPFVS